MAPVWHLRSVAVSKYCGVSVDTRMAPGGVDAGPHHTEKHDRAPTGPNVYETLGLSPRLRVSYLPTSSFPGATRVSTDTPQDYLTVTLLRAPMGSQHREPPPVAASRLQSRRSVSDPRVTPTTADACVLQIFTHVNSRTSYIARGGSTSQSVGHDRHTCPGRFVALRTPPSKVNISPLYLNLSGDRKDSLGCGVRCVRCVHRVPGCACGWRSVLKVE